MTQAFDKNYWESHWQQANGPAPGREIDPNPYLARELSSLTPSTALDAGCGEGAEAIWLATEGWQVTAADISTEALSRASERATKGCATPERVQWVEADLSVWEPGKQFDLVTTHYAHPAMPQLAFYERISHWVAPGGTLLIVGHLHTPDTTGHGHSQEQQGHGHNPPEEVSFTAARITVALDASQWDIVTADEPTRTLTNRAGRTVQLGDVVVRATRLCRPRSVSALGGSPKATGGSCTPRSHGGASWRTLHVARATLCDLWTDHRRSLGMWHRASRALRDRESRGERMYPTERPPFVTPLPPLEKLSPAVLRQTMEQVMREYLARSALPSSGGAATATRLTVATPDVR